MHHPNGYAIPYGGRNLVWEATPSTLRNFLIHSTSNNKWNSLSNVSRSCSCLWIGKWSKWGYYVFHGHSLYIYTFGKKVIVLSSYTTGTNSHKIWLNSFNIQNQAYRTIKILKSPNLRFSPSRLLGIERPKGWTSLSRIASVGSQQTRWSRKNNENVRSSRTILVQTELQRHYILNDVETAKRNYESL